MRTNIIATAALAALLLGSGVSEPRAAEMTAIQKGAFSVGFVNMAQSLCPDIEVSGLLKGYVNVLVEETAKNRDLWPYYEDGIPRRWCH
jgi:hypothetical protein